MRQPWTWVILLVVVGLAPAAQSGPGAQASGDEEAGALAPAGCWYIRDGCAARTGRARTEAVRGALETAWEYALSEAGGGSIEEEPRVWLGRVVLSVEASPTHRALHVLNLCDGRPVAKPLRFETTEPLAPCLWQDRIVVRAAPDRLEAYVVRRGKLRKTWSASGSDLGEPVLLGETLYVLDGDDVVAWRIGGKTPQWRARGPYRGRLSVRGPCVVAIRYDEPGNAHLAQIDRRTGRELRADFIGHHGTRGALHRAFANAIIVGQDDLFVQHGVPVRTQNEGSAQTTWLRRRAGPSAAATLECGGLYDFVAPPIEAGSRWLMLIRDREKGLQLLHGEQSGEGGVRSSVLADRAQHADLLGTTLPFAAADGVAWVGGVGFDVCSYDVTWKSRHSLLFRPVPARDHLLVVDAPGRLRALREVGGGDSAGVCLGPAREEEAAEEEALVVETKGAVLWTDWSVYEGTFRIRPGRGVLEVPKGKRRVDTHSLADVHVAVAEDGGLLYTNDLADTLWALRTLDFRRRAHDYVDLAKEACRAHDAALASRFIEEAAMRGAGEKELTALRKRWARLVDRPQKTSTKGVARVREKEARIREEAGETVRRTLATGLDDPRWRVRRHFVTEVLRLDPTAPRPATLVKDEMPSFLEIPTPFDPLAWLDVVGALREVEVGPIHVPEDAREGDLSRSQCELGSSRHVWRKDLVGLESEQLLIITPLRQPGRIATCLSLGELTCRALEDLFRGGERVHMNRYPLILQLFETKEEYTAFAERFASTRTGGLEHTAGHYDPTAGVTRIYLPGRDTAAFRGVMDTYAHELTHHWIQERCPLFKAADAKPRPNGPGFWIVEGMAKFVEEFDWDLERRTWRTANPRAQSLDILANSTPDQRIGWARFYGLSGMGFFRLDTEVKEKVAMCWRLGWFNRASELQMFYVQAAATCHYLFHADEDTRSHLLEYVKAYYTGRIRRGEPHIRTHFSADPQALGAAVMRYAKETVNRP